MADALSRVDPLSTSLCNDNNDNVSEETEEKHDFLADRNAINKNETISDKILRGINPQRIIKINSCNTNRVLVYISKGKAAQQGIRKDDVLTHVNGEKFNGNAFELN